MEVGAAGDEREGDAAGYEADDELAAPIEREASAGDAGDDLRVAAGDSESLVEQQSDRDHAEAEDRTGDVPGELMVKHGGASFADGC